MSLLKSLFGIDPVVGEPKRAEKDWDQSIHAECDDPTLSGPFTGGTVVSLREWMLTHDRGMGVPESKPSAWRPFDALVIIIPAVLLAAIIVLGLITAIMADLLPH